MVPESGGNWKANGSPESVQKLIEVPGGGQVVGEWLANVGPQRSMLPVPVATIALLRSPLRMANVGMI